MLRKEVFAGIEVKNILGFKGIQLLKRESGPEAVFTTIMWFESIESVKQFAGDNYTAAYVPAKARLLLKHFDETAEHSALLYSINQ